MNTRTLLCSTAILSCFATGALAGPPQLDGLSSSRALRGPTAAHAALSGSAAATHSQAAVRNSVAIDRHVKQWVTFDVPEAGPAGTFPSAINDLGEITGNYNDASPQQLQHGFVRYANGQITSFDPSGSTQTNPESINNHGDVAGWFIDAAGNYHGFVRSARGKIRVIDEPYDAIGFTVVHGINDFGAIVGKYYDANIVGHGFLREPSGTYHTIDGPDSVNTSCGHINVQGEVLCDFVDGNGNNYHGLLRYPGGALVAFDAPGAGTGGGYEFGTFAGGGLNVEGQAAGEYADSNNGYHGYLRRANGSFVEFTVAGGGTDNANGTYPAGLNFWGLITGYWFDSNGFVSGFVRFADGTIDSFQAPDPDNQGTLAFGVNLENQFTGFFSDASGTYHGFVARAVP